MVKGLLKKLMGIRDEPDITARQEVFEQFTIIKGQYADNQTQYIEVGDVIKYLEKYDGRFKQV